LIDYMQTLWQFRDGKWMNIVLPVMAYGIHIFKLNDDDIPDMVLFHIVTETLPNQAFSIFLGQEGNTFNRIFDYTACSNALGEEVTFFQGRCSSFKMNCLQLAGPIDRIMTFDCRTNSVITKSINRLEPNIK